MTQLIAVQFMGSPRIMYYTRALVTPAFVADANNAKFYTNQVELEKDIDFLVAYFKGSGFSFLPMEAT